MPRKKDELLLVPLRDINSCLVLSEEDQRNSSWNMFLDVHVFRVTNSLQGGILLVLDVRHAKRRMHWGKVPFRAWDSKLRLVLSYCVFTCWGGNVGYRRWAEHRGTKGDTNVPSFTMVHHWCFELYVLTSLAPVHVCMCFTWCAFEQSWGRTAKLHSSHFGAWVSLVSWKNRHNRLLKSVLIFCAFVTKWWQIQWPRKYTEMQ